MDRPIVVKSEKDKFVEATRGARKRTIKNGDIADIVLQQKKFLLQSSHVTSYIMKSYIDMLRLYNERTKSFALDALKPIYDEALIGLERERVDDKTLSLLEKVYEYDYELHNSSGQAKRNARGFFLESVLNSLFEYYAHDQFMSQVKIVDEGHEKRIDFVIGSSSKYDDITNPLYVTVKKSLRERGAQVSDEKRFLDSKILFFFYADDLKRLSEGIMKKFYDEDIVMVTYEHLVNTHYDNKKNVISYEKFFLELLPAYLKDKEGFKATDFGIETLRQRGPGFVLKKHA